MQIEKRSLNWLPRASAYDEAVASREKRKATHEAFISSQSALSSTIADISTAQVSETVNITSRVALARVTKTA
jgi:hypothetical protein